MLYLILFFITAFSFGQVTLSKDVLEVVKMLSVSESDSNTLQEISDATNKEEKDCPPELTKPKPTLVLFDKKEVKESPWKFSIRSTLTGPKGKLEKNFIQADQSYALQNKLNSIIYGDYSSYQERMRSVGEACKGLNEGQKISMASLLAGKLSRIYDYSRANGGSDAIIRPEDQWQALKSNNPKGVCRDASITVSQFLLACGFNRDQVAIKSYRTQNGGHQVTSIKTSDGEYTLNWDELYNTKESVAPEPNIPNTGMFYTLYDPETGKILEEKRTELAEALKLLAGGTPQDPTYTPQMIVAEAAYGGFAAKIFETRDFLGNDAAGMALSATYTKGNERSFISLSSGVAYAKNERQLNISQDNNQKLTQDIIYLQSEMKLQKELPLFDNHNGRLVLAPNVGTSLDFYVTKNKLNGHSSISYDGLAQASVGSTVFYDRDPIKAHIGTEVVSNFSQLYNSENEKRPFGFYLSRYSMQGGVSWDAGRMVASVDANIIVTQTEKQRVMGLTLRDKKTSTSCQAIYSVYDRSYSTREDYLITRCSKDFSVKLLGKVTLDASAKVPLFDGHKDVIYNLGASVDLK